MFNSRVIRSALAAPSVGDVVVSGEDYLTEGIDNGRTGWLKNETIFNTSNVRTMTLLWVRPRAALKPRGRA